jgi:hypothetical protein
MTIVSQLREVAERTEITIDELLEFLDSPTGRRFRSIVATGLILSVPMIMRIPGLRRSPIGRMVEVAGGAAIVVKLAELIRDWERSERSRGRRRTIDVPAAG